MNLAEFKTLDDLSSAAAVCTACKLSRTRSKVVFGEGSKQARIMFIGEGPGATEDATGRPFVGRAGELLTRIIEKGIGIQRSEVYIANIVKCRPTVNQEMKKDRPPEPEETAACTPFLIRQIELIKPGAIVALGGPSAKFLLNTSEGITRLRGKWGEYQGVPVMPTFHPSYVLRNGGDKSPLRKQVWEDIQLVMQRVGIPVPAR